MRRARTLLRDTRGVAAVEFAIIAPTFALLLVGGFDVAHSLYMRGVMQGVLQKTARDSALESGGSAAQQTAIDNKVRDQVLAIHRQATVRFKRRYYRNFAEATAKIAERVTHDSNANGWCDTGDRYVDANNNNGWDDDGGNEGQGGAKDRVLYTVTVSYPRMLPLHKFITALPSTEVVTASAALINQPYTDQASYGPPVERTCS